MSKYSHTFNKQIEQSNTNFSGHGTKMANWYEEQVLRRKTGIGRSVPGSHQPKLHDSLYTQDFGGVAQIPRDDTFVRCFPDPQGALPLTCNQEYGRFENKADKVPRTGKRFELIEKQVVSLTKTVFRTESKRLGGEREN
jgi:hypothetical protein